MTEEVETKGGDAFLVQHCLQACVSSSVFTCGEAVAQCHKGSFCVTCGIRKHSAQFDAFAARKKEFIFHGTFGLSLNCETESPHYIIGLSNLKTGY